jgi:altronate hydrolase
MSAPRALRLHAQDNVMVAVDEVRPGAAPVAVDFVPKDHKFATAPGQWVHEHNCSVGHFDRDYGFSQDARPVNVLPVESQATFQGFRRA